MPSLFPNIAVMYALCLVQEEMVKTAFCHESVCNQEVFASKKTSSYWWKKAPHQPITKSYGKPRDLVAGKQEWLWEGWQRMTDSSSDGDRDSEFCELKDWCLNACLECIVSV